MSAFCHIWKKTTSQAPVPLAPFVVRLPLCPFVFDSTRRARAALDLLMCRRWPERTALRFMLLPPPSSASFPLQERMALLPKKPTRSFVANRRVSYPSWPQVLSTQACAHRGILVRRNTEILGTVSLANCEARISISENVPLALYPTLKWLLPLGTRGMNNRKPGGDLPQCHHRSRRTSVPGGEPCSGL